MYFYLIIKLRFHKKEFYFTMKNLHLEQRFLSTHGRINRQIFILYFICFLLFATLMIVPTSSIIIGNSSDLIIEIITTISSVTIEIAFLPSLFLTAKRLHDLNKSAVYMTLYVIPFINILFFLYLCLAKGTSGENKYGPDPLNLEI